MTPTREAIVALLATGGADALLAAYDLVPKPQPESEETRVAKELFHAWCPGSRSVWADASQGGYLNLARYAIAMRDEAVQDALERGAQAIDESAKNAECRFCSAGTKTLRAFAAREKGARRG